jgi:hypothetical protein
MIFSTLFIVLFFLNGPAFSALPDATTAKNHIKEIQTIIGGDLSPALSILLSEKENWEFLSNKISNLKPNSVSSNIVVDFFEKFHIRVMTDFGKLGKSYIDSDLYEAYGKTTYSLQKNPVYDFFPKCIKLLKVLRDMKNPQIVNKEKAAYKKPFENAPTPVKFLTDLFEAFKKMVQVFPLDKTDNDHLTKLKAAVDEPLATVKVPDSKPPADNTNPPPKDEWSNLKKAFVFGSIALVILAIISIIVFFVLRKSKSTASSA